MDSTLLVFIIKSCPDDKHHYEFIPNVDLYSIRCYCYWLHLLSKYFEVSQRFCAQSRRTVNDVTRLFRSKMALCLRLYN